MKKIIITTFLLVMLGVGYWFFAPNLNNTDDISLKSSDPLNTTYIIDGSEVTLVDGKAESVVVPDSNARKVTTVFGRPNYGDINGDGVDDAVTIATQTSGGTGTFYYALVSLEKDGLFEGLSAVFLGDRIAPQSVLIKNNIVMVNYADRASGEPMTSSPSVGVTKYLTVEDGKVSEYNILNKGEQLFSGNLIMSHEVRTFTPCGGTARWVIGTSTAYKNLTDAYNMYKSTTTAYSSVFVTVSGIIVSVPTDGFGADYDYGIDIKTLLKVHPNKTCSNI